MVVMAALLVGTGTYLRCCSDGILCCWCGCWDCACCCCWGGVIKCGTPGLLICCAAMALRLALARWAPRSLSRSVLSIRSTRSTTILSAIRSSSRAARPLVTLEPRLDLRSRCSPRIPPPPPTPAPATAGRPPPNPEITGPAMAIKNVSRKHSATI